MSGAKKLEDIWASALDQIEALDPKIDDQLDGAAPGQKTPNREQHMAWMQMQIMQNEQKYPPQMYMTPQGPRMASLWVLTRPFVHGWDKEFARYLRESKAMQP